MGGHSGVFRTFKRLSGMFFWEGMRKDIQNYVAQCEICQKNKYQALNPAGLLQPLPIPQQVWEDISMDFITGLPKFLKFDTILVVVDRLTKYGHFIAMSHPFTAKEVAETFVKEVVKLHGFPRSIVLDRDRVFISRFWQELFKLIGTSLKYSFIYHPETDGQTEVVNKSLETYLRCFMNEKPREWAKWLPWAEYWFNTNFNVPAGMTPFKPLYGRELPSILKVGNEVTSMEAIDEQLKARDGILTELKRHLSQAQQQIKAQTDKRRRDVQFAIGGQVYLRTKPYKLKLRAL